MKHLLMALFTCLLLTHSKTASSFKPLKIYESVYFCCSTNEYTFGGFDVSHLGQSGQYDLIVDLNGNGIWPQDFRLKSQGTSSVVSFPMYMTHDGGGTSKVFQGGVTVDAQPFLIKYSCVTNLATGGYTVSVEVKGV